jgi:hypothetical protein
MALYLIIIMRLTLGANIDQCQRHSDRCVTTQTTAHCATKVRNRSSTFELANQLFVGLALARFGLATVAVDNFAIEQQTSENASFVSCQATAQD